MKRWKKVVILATFLCLNLLLFSFTYATIYRKPENTNREHQGVGQEALGAQRKLAVTERTYVTRAEEPRFHLAHGNKPTSKNATAMGQEQVVVQNRPYFPRKSEKLEVLALLNFTLKPEIDLCKSNTKLLIAVCSSLDHFERREAIRATWGNMSFLEDLQVAIVFIVGLPQPKNQHLQSFLVEEHAVHGDVVQLNHVDHYRNLSLKSLGMLHWSIEHCIAATHLLKTDDDIFLNVPYLMRHLDGNGYSNRRTFILGSIIQAAQPVRSRTSKWFTPDSVYRGDIYPPYTSGTAYLLSGDVVVGLAKEGRNRPIFWLEDIFLTGILAKTLDVELIHDDRFNYKRAARQRDLCWYKTVFTDHDIRPQDLFRIWKFAGVDDERNDLLWINCRNSTQFKRFQAFS